MKDNEGLIENITIHFNCPHCGTQIDTEPIDLESTMVSIVHSQVKRMRKALKEIRDLARWHADIDADPEDQSPEDAVAHVNGLIMQICSRAI